VVCNNSRCAHQRWAAVFEERERSCGDEQVRLLAGNAKSRKATHAMRP
jgi:hypothetical protein